MLYLFLEANKEQKTVVPAVRLDGGSVIRGEVGFIFHECFPLSLASDLSHHTAAVRQVFTLKAITT